MSKKHHNKLQRLVEGRDELKRRATALQRELKKSDCKVKQAQREFARLNLQSERQECAVRSFTEELEEWLMSDHVFTLYNIEDELDQLTDKS